MDLLNFREWLSEDKKPSRNGAVISLPNGSMKAKKKELKDKILRAKNDKELAAAVDEIMAMGLRLKPKKDRENLRRWLTERKLACLVALLEMADK